MPTSFTISVSIAEPPDDITKFGDELRAWDATASMFGKMLSSEDEMGNSLSGSDIKSAQEILSLIDSTGGAKRALHQNAREISYSIANKIENENKALQNESNELSRWIQLVHALEDEVGNLEDEVGTLEDEVGTLTKHLSELISKRREAHHNIVLYKAEAAEEIEKVDEVLLRYVRAVPKIKMTYTLFATITNVKWDYSRTDVLAGEVSIPSKSIHQLFQIEKDLPEFEIVEKFWSIVEG